MTLKKLENEILIERAKSVIACLKNSVGWVKLKDVAERTRLTEGQVKAAVKFERRWFLESPEKCGTSYILSGARGYKLPQTDDDYVMMYKSLYAWGKSVLITISPIGKYLQGKGFDMAEIRREAMAANGLIQDSIGGTDSWQDND